MKNSLIKKLILPICTIFVASSMIVGATYALFTSRDETNIVVSSGKVNLRAEAKDVTLYSPTKIDLDGTIVDDTNAATTKFANGGTATLNNGNLSLNNVCPGDKATFKISFTNTSNISIKYRVLFIDETIYSGTETHKLVDALRFTCGTTYIAPGNVIKEWTGVEPNEPIADLLISAELPSTFGNDYQELSSDLKFVVEAVQGNASTQSGDVVELTAVNGETGDLIYFYQTDTNYEFKKDITYVVTAITDTDIPIMYAAITHKDVLEWELDDFPTLATLISFKDDGVELDTQYEDGLWYPTASYAWTIGLEGVITATFKMLVDYTGTFFFSLGL